MFVSFCYEHVHAIFLFVDKIRSFMHFLAAVLIVCGAGGQILDNKFTNDCMSFNVLSSEYVFVIYRVTL